MSDHEVLVLGAGLAGMSTGIAYGPGAVVLERQERPGGLVQCVEIDGYWFDHVIHLLYFQDPQIEARVAPLLEGLLAPRPPDAWVVTSAGTARFPLQMHLGHLDQEAAVDCLEGMARVLVTDASPRNYDELLRASFGDGLYDLFFKPYNDKMWRRPLDELAPAGFQWNLHRPDLREAIRGALGPDRNAGSYNANGFYPRPPADAPVRGMECLSLALAAAVPDLRLEHEVVGIDPVRRTVRVGRRGASQELTWSERCVSTLPLPRALSLCAGVPPDLLEAVSALRRNGVVSLMIRVEGPRPSAGTWRYYADPDLIFTRLVFLHEFDPLMAPPEGWPLLAEVPWRAEDPLDRDALAQRVLDDVRRTGELPEGSRILGVDVHWVDPAYVCFDLDSKDTVQAGLSWLREHGVEPVGRYGRWEYSSMAGAIGDGLALGDALRDEARP